MIKKEYSERKINFDESFKFYMKDRKSYIPKQCHENSYIRFDDRNQQFVDQSKNDITFHTGLQCNKKLNICIIHSWVEYKGNIIDVTSMANSGFVYSVEIDSKAKHDAKKFFEQNIRYINYNIISNSEFTRIINECAFESNNNQETLNRLLSKRLNDLANLIKNDEQYLIKVKNKFGYTLSDGIFVEDLR